MGFMDFFRKKNSGEVAKDRLKLLLISDRANCSPEIMEAIKNDIIKVITKYMDIDKMCIRDSNCTHDSGMLSPSEHGISEPFYCFYQSESSDYPHLCLWIYEGQEGGNGSRIFLRTVGRHLFRAASGNARPLVFLYWLCQWIFQMCIRDRYFHEEEKPGVERSGLEPFDWSDQKIYLPYYQMPRL